MKVALVIPAWAPAEIFPSRTAASQINYWQPIGTLSVAASLRAAGHEVRRRARHGPARVGGGVVRDRDEPAAHCRGRERSRACPTIARSRSR